MGKLMHNTQIKHSSHPHLLHLLSPSRLAINLQNITCAGCNQFISASDVYGCTPCNFFLHPSCAKFPDLITHPSHPHHTLSLLPTPIYPGGFFRCDACAQQGSRFSYHCQICDFDLHVLCASKPLSVNLPAYHPHPLLLTFASPYGEKSGFSCDVCPGIGSPDQWLYRCVSCEFDVHLHCATAPAPVPLNHNVSFPGAIRHNQFVSARPLVSQHSVSSAGYAHNAPFPAQTYQGPPAQPPPAPVPVQTYQPVANQNVNGLANVIVTGFVDGMMQQLGQNFVQGLTGGDSGGGNGGGGNGGGGDVVNVDYECSTVNDGDYNN